MTNTTDGGAKASLPKNIQTWVVALRSGDYPQTRGTLCSPDGYCCLGVYAVVNGISGYDDMVVNVDKDGHVNSEGPTEIYTQIRNEVDHSVVDSGITMNDDGGSPFEDIADMIEEYYSNPDLAEPTNGRT